MPNASMSDRVAEAIGREKRQLTNKEEKSKDVAEEGLH